ncbi:Histidinol-phosphate aminotransferase [compost metagenome]
MRFVTELSKIPFLKVYPSEANYLLCELSQGLIATEVTQKLLFEDGLYVKDLTGKKGFEGKEFLRVAVRDESDNNKLVKSLTELSWKY